MKIISCGCSFTYGSGPSDKSFMLGKVKNYSEFLQDMTSSELENLAFPGCSNYGIIKQVEHAVEKQPDLILFNTTTSMRYEIIRPDKCVEGEPHFKDFSSINNIGGTVTSAHYTIIQSMLSGRQHNPDIFNSRWNWGKFSEQHYEEIFNYLIKYQDVSVKTDQDKLMINGAIAALKHTGIPFVAIDCVGLIREDCTTIDLPWQEYVKQYPLELDEWHWNEQGHQALANRINKLL